MCENGGWEGLCSPINQSLNQQLESGSVVSAQREHKLKNEQQNKVKPSTANGKWEGSQSGVAVHHTGRQVE